MWPILITLILGSTKVNSYICGGDMTSLNETLHKGRILQDYSREYTISPIRLTFYYTDSFTLGTQTEDSNFDSLLTSVKNFYSRALYVRRLTNPLQLLSTYCTNSIKVPTSHNTDGIPDTDIIVYLKNINDNVSYIASAGACEVQYGGRGNVVAGAIFIGTNVYVTQTTQGKLTSLMHEMTHILGFSTLLYSKFTNAVGTLYTVTKSVTVRGLSKYLFTGPNALSKAKAAFACSSIEGIELEDNNCNFASSHWDRRIMANDYMITYVVQDPIISTVTLGLLQDSGWYYPDYSMGTVPIIGKGSGCSYFTDKCLKNGIPSSKTLWCNTTQTWTCDNFALNKASCNIYTYSTKLPSNNQYFKSPYIGGLDAYADYCPYKKGFVNGSCRGNGITTYTVYGSNEVIGPNSRCFSSTLVLVGNKSPSEYAACYSVKGCNSTGAVVTVGSVDVFCSFLGGNVKVNGYNGVLSCPVGNLLCSDVPCLNLCFGQGKCVSGLCQCFPGFSGPDCSVTS